MAADPAQAVPKPAESNKRVRNHGLFSKAQRALDIAGWSPRAQEDVEIYRLVDTDGLTPLLIVLNDAKPNTAARPAEAAEPAEVARSYGLAANGSTANGSEAAHAPPSLT
jgi:hypothetical protein